MSDDLTSPNDISSSKEKIEDGIYLVFEVPSSDTDIINFMKTEFGSLKLIKPMEISADVGTILGIVGVSLTSWQILEKFIGKYSDRNGVFLNIQGRKIPLSKIDALDIKGQLDEKHDINISINARNETK